MKHINQVTLQGTVGSVKFYPIVEGGPRSVRFSLATNQYFQTKDGACIIETTWHSLSLLESEPNHFSWLEKGKTVYLTGRIRNVRVTDNQGVERVVTDIIVEDIYPVNE